MIKKSKKVISMVLVLIMVFSSVVTVQAQDISEELVNIIIYEDENRVLSADVPIEHVNSYIDRLENEKNFRQDEINKVLSNPNSRRFSHLPILDFWRMDESDIENKVNSLNPPDSYSSILRTHGVAGAITIISSLLKASNAIGFVAAILSVSADLLNHKNNNWWNESLELIMTGSISAIEQTIYNNTDSTYPAVYIIIERV